jgi:hypothetical protein
VLYIYVTIGIVGTASLSELWRMQSELGYHLLIQHNKEIRQAGYTHSTDFSGLVPTVGTSVVHDNDHGRSNLTVSRDRGSKPRRVIPVGTRGIHTVVVRSAVRSVTSVPVSSPELVSR